MHHQVRRLSAVALLLAGFSCCAGAPGDSAALAPTPLASTPLASTPLTSTALAATPNRAGANSPSPSSPSQITLPLTPAPGVAIAMRPVGLSLEYSTMAQDLGAGPCPPPALTAELRRLGSPPLALAGESQDLTAPPGALTGLAPSWETATCSPWPCRGPSGVSCTAC